MVSRSWWGEGTKSFSKILLLSKKASGRMKKRDGHRKHLCVRRNKSIPNPRIGALSYKDDHHSPIPSVTYCTNTPIGQYPPPRAPFPPSLAGLSLSFGCRHPRGTRDRWRHYHGHGVRLWLPARLYRATVHSALRAEFQQPRKAGTRCDGARSRQRPIARCYAIGRIEDCRSRYGWVMRF
jgi:hypothetical protein